MSEQKQIAKRQLRILRRNRKKAMPDDVRQFRENRAKLTPDLLITNQPMSFAEMGVWNWLTKYLKRKTNPKNN